MRTLLALSVVALLCACGDRAPGSKEDFGAAQTARAAVNANRACAADGFEDLESCTESPSQDTRRGAKTALLMTDVYMRTCTADLSYDRCNDMLTAAYLVAQK